MQEEDVRVIGGLCHLGWHLDGDHACRGGTRTTVELGQPLAPTPNLVRGRVIGLGVGLGLGVGVGVGVELGF